MRMPVASLRSQISTISSKPVCALVLGTVQLDHERRAGVGGVARAGRALGRLDRELVHDLHRARDQPGGHDLRHRAPGLLHVRVEGDQRPPCRRRRHDAQRDPGGDAERPLRSDERAQQVVARGVDRLAAAQLNDLAVGQHDLEPGHVVGREPVLEAVRSAGVLGDVAADRADDLARRIGRVVVAGADRRADLQVGHARLDDDALVVQVDVDDPPHPRQDDQHAVLHRKRAARQARARSARDRRHAGVVTRLDDAPHLVRIPGQHRGARHDRVLQQPVGLVRAQLVLVREDVLVAADLGQLGDQLVGGIYGDGHTRELLRRPSSPGPASTAGTRAPP